jgi:AcrR family transcriptional regulator
MSELTPELLSAHRAPDLPIAIRLRRQYRIDMPVSRQVRKVPRASAAGPRARMKRVLLDTAMRLMQGGRIPSVSDVAEAATVSRATAYRYFPTQAAMIQEAVNEALGPILAWSSASDDAEERVAELLAFAYPRIEAYEATHRATLLLSLYQWAQRTAGTLGNEAEIVRGNRRRLLVDAVAPLKKRLGRRSFDRLTQSLSLVFGTEAFVVLKDIWGLDGDEARRVAIWAAHALVRAAIAEESAATGRITAVKGGTRTAVGPPRKMH